MAKDWYQGRAPRRRGLEYRDARVGLNPDDWQALDKLAADKSRSRSYLISSIVLKYVRHVGQQRSNRSAESFAADKARNGDDSWLIRD